MPQLAWIGLGNMGRVSESEQVTAGANGCLAGHVQEYRRKG